MRQWIRDHLTGRTSPASDRAAQLVRDLDELVSRRQGEADETEVVERNRRQRLVETDPMRYDPIRQRIGQGGMPR